jgi:hypothetical protein
VVRGRSTIGCELLESGTRKDGLQYVEMGKGKATLVTGPGDPLDCERSRFPYFLDNRLTDGGEAVNLTRRPPFTPRKVPGTYFCYRLSRPQGHSAARRISSIEKSSELIGN